ncbi:hypothetical protein IG631_24092 [Alternaria alternata]|nr:hypothetical protein IG631_24092 [Alternaria alternata]
MADPLHGYGSKRRPLSPPSPAHGLLRRHTQHSSRPALPQQQIHQPQIVVPSVILHVHPVGRQAGPLRRIAKNAILRPGTKTLAGRIKRDHRADTMEECGSKAGPGSRDRDGIPPRPGLREASEDWEATVLPYLPLGREDREDKYRLQWV